MDPSHTHTHYTVYILGIQSPFIQAAYTCAVSHITVVSLMTSLGCELLIPSCCLHSFWTNLFFRFIFNFHFFYFILFSWFSLIFCVFLLSLVYSHSFLCCVCHFIDFFLSESLFLLATYVHISHCFAAAHPRYQRHLPFIPACYTQGRIKLFGAPRQWKHFRPLFQAVFLSRGGYYPPDSQTPRLPVPRQK